MISRHPGRHPGSGAVLAASTGNGADTPPRNPTQQLDAEELKRRTRFARDISASFGQLISLMMQSRQHRHVMITELEWLLVPALAVRQFCVLEGVSQEQGLVAPVAAVLWAMVSPEVDKRISENLEAPIRLKPNEWRAGPHVWIIETLGEPKAVTMLLQHVMQGDLKGKLVRMRVVGQDGKVSIGRVELQPAEPSSASAPSILSS